MGTKVGLITHYMPPHSGGIERVAETLAAAYTRHGLEVRWVASRSPADAPAREAGRIRVPCWNAMEQRLQVPLPLWGIGGWREVESLAGWADVLHVHDCLYPGSVAAAICRQRFGVPILLSQHVGMRAFATPLLTTVARLAYATLGRWVLSSASHVVCPAAAAQQLVTGLLGCAPDDAPLIPNGIDTARFRPATPDEQLSARSRLGVPPDVPVVLFVGRLVAQKGVALLVQAIRQLPACHFLIVGDGPLGSDLPRASNVTWSRWVAPEAIHEYYQAAECLLLPSHGEASGLVVQEAAACGLVIVLPEGESFAEPLSQREACLAIQRTSEGTVTGVAEAVSVNMTHLGRNARRYAEEHWSLSQMTARYVGLIQELSAARGHPHPGGARGCWAGRNEEARP